VAELQTQITGFEKLIVALRKGASDMQRKAPPGNPRHEHKVRRLDRLVRNVPLDLRRVHSLPGPVTGMLRDFAPNEV